MISQNYYILLDMICNKFGSWIVSKWTKTDWTQLLSQSSFYCRIRATICIIPSGMASIKSVCISSRNLEGGLSPRVWKLLCALCLICLIAHPSEILIFV